MKKEIPCHLIAGFSGSGKSTFIKQLLAYKPAGEKWAVLVNEQGNSQYPYAHYQAHNVFIKDVHGGCLCCTAGIPFRVALNNLLKQVNPDRLFIEPSGAGHLVNIKQLLQGPFYQSILQLKAVICMLSEKQLADKKYAQNTGYLALIAQADKLCVKNNLNTDLAVTMADQYDKPLYLLQGAEQDLDFIT